MRNLIFISFLFISTLGFSQENISTQGNTITTKESAPVWPGCESAKEEKECFNKNLVKWVQENYKFPKDAEGNYIRGKAVVSFIINKKGAVEILSVKGEKPALNAEAKRIILTIPEMKPGELAGKPIDVKYTIPFTF